MLITALPGALIEIVHRGEGYALEFNGFFQLLMLGAGLFHGLCVLLGLGGPESGLEFLVLFVDGFESVLHGGCLLLSCALRLSECYHRHPQKESSFGCFFELNLQLFQPFHR